MCQPRASVESSDPFVSVWLNYNPKAKSYNVTEDGKLLKVFTTKAKALAWLEFGAYVWFDNSIGEAQA